MPVIYIYGASGSGTSTLGSALQTQYQYCHLDTDDYYWMPADPPFTLKRPVGERVALLKKDIGKSSRTVVSGSLCGWGDELIPLFDLVIRLVVPTNERIERLKKREFKRFGNRICEGGDMHKDHLKFMQWAAEYDAGDVTMRSRAMHDEWQRLIRCCHLTLDGTLCTEKLLEEINTNLLL